MSGRRMAAAALAVLLIALPAGAEAGAPVPPPPPVSALPFPSATEEAAPVPAGSGNPEQFLRRGNALYEENRFGEAAEAYGTALAYGFENEILHFNRGNALFRAGRLGPAILEYERALLLAPGDGDIRANLEFARAQCADAPPEEEENPLTLLGRWLRRPDVNGAAGLALAVYLVGAAALGLALLRRGTRPARFMAALAVVGFLLSLPPALVVGVQGITRELDDRAVVLVPRAESRSGPAASHPLLFTVHEGTTVQVLDRREGWSRISLHEGLNGWIPDQAIARIRAQGT